MRASLASLWLVTAGVLAVGCGDDESATIDAGAPDAATDAPVDAVNLMPELLSETGLYSNIATRTLAPGVVEFAPRWELFSDAASKRRWIWLPPGTKIDTADMDFWSFPQGTRVWKEFARDGVVIETRLLQKNGPTDDVSDWYMVSFQWNAAMTDATAVPAGVVDDAGHNDIPSRSDCRKCHGPNRMPSVVLGFGAIQLDHDLPEAQLDLARLVAEDRLTVSPTGSASGYFPIPSAGAVQAVPQAALGYLHANCGGCHNHRSELTEPPTPQTPLELRLRTEASFRTSWQATRSHLTTVNVHTTVGSTVPFVVVPNDLDASVLYSRLTAIGANQMPPVGRETADLPGGVAAVRAWIQSL